MPPSTARPPVTPASDVAGAGHARIQAATKAKLKERGEHWRGQGLNDAQTRRELQREGFQAPDITDWLGEAGGEEKPAATGGDHPASAAAPASPAAPRATTTRSRGGSTSGLLAALVVYPLALAYLQNGSSGVKAWLRAKFLNQTATDPGINAETFFGNRGPTAGGGSGGGVAPTAYTASPQRSKTFLAPRLSPSDPYVATPVPAKPKTKALDPTQHAAGELSHASGKAITALTFAENQIGKPYRWGATGPNAFDCSGLVQAAYARAGVHLPRTTYGMLTAGRRVSKANLIPGDLVFPDPGHVQLYFADGLVIEAPHTGANVRNAHLGAVMTARRVA